MEKVELCSPAWFVALKELLIVYAAEFRREFGNDFELSICETFTAVPAHLDRDGTGVRPWHFIMKNGTVHFEETAIPEADAHVEVDYQFILHIAHWVYKPEDMPEVNAYTARGRAEGKIKSRDRNRAKVPPGFVRLHNELAARTL